MRAEPAAVFAALDERGLRSTFDAAEAARLLVFSFRAILNHLLSELVIEAYPAAIDSSSRLSIAATDPPLRD